MTEMFIHLGKTLTLLRSVRGLRQEAVARAAGIGKSQLSKYESGRELPKLDSLERVLKALDVGPAQFFFALSLVDQSALQLDGNRRQEDVPDVTRTLRPLSAPLEQAFSRIFHELLGLYRASFEDTIFGALGKDGIP